MDGSKYVVEYFLCNGSAKYTRASPIARKMLFSSNLNVQNSVVMFTFSNFDRKYPFWVNFSPKTKNCQFILKFGTWTNPNLQKAMAMFNFSTFDWNYPWYP